MACPKHTSLHVLVVVVVVVVFAMVLLTQTFKGSSQIRECSGKYKFCARLMGKVRRIFVKGGGRGERGWKKT